VGGDTASFRLATLPFGVEINTISVKYYCNIVQYRVHAFWSERMPQLVNATPPSAVPIITSNRIASSHRNCTSEAKHTSIGMVRLPATYAMHR
jgi:hypothetical protein